MPSFKVVRLTDDRVTQLRLAAGTDVAIQRINKVVRVKRGATPDPFSFRP